MAPLKYMWFGGLALSVLLVAQCASAQTLSPLELEGSRAQADALLGQVPVAEVLGPMAPLALSPFFGLTCLSGMALLEDQGWFPNNALLQQHPMLSDYRFFLVLLALTLLTSLPKMLTVSKFFAQALDQVEAYSGLLLFLLVFVWARVAEPPMDSQVVRAGILEVGESLLLMVACIVNFIVINTVKYLFELLVLLTPVPLLDAAFEISNKALCLGLAIAYAYNPYVALIPGAVLFLCCLPIFWWARKSMIYYKTLLLDPIIKGALSRVLGRPVPEVPSPVTRHVAHACGEPVQLAVKVFAGCAVAEIPARRLCYLALTRRGPYLVYLRWFLAPVVVPLLDSKSVIKTGILLNRISITRAENAPVNLVFSRYHRSHLDQIAEGLGAAAPAVHANQSADLSWSKDLLRAEFGRSDPGA